MDNPRGPIRVLVAAMMLGALGCAAQAGEPRALPLWPEAALPAIPAERAKAEKVEERGKADQHDRFIRDTSVPTLTVYLPDLDEATGAAVVICPGGGYGGVAIDKEGYDVARWLNTLGVAGIVLKYRTPRADLAAGATPWPVQDAQRAIRLVRSRAAEWKLDPRRVGILGFSAGGHLAAVAGTRFDPGKPDAADALDRLSCRPDFLILVYPVTTLRDPIGHSGSRVALLGKAADPARVDEYSPVLQVTAQTPPTFLVHAKDDGVKVQNSALFYAALQQAGVPAEFQCYEKGGHAFGLGTKGGEVATWPGRCAAWMKGRGLLPAAR